MNISRSTCVLTVRNSASTVLWLIVALICAHPANAQVASAISQQVDVTGEWDVTVGSQQLKMKLQQSSEGALGGNITVPAQKVTLPLESVSLSANGILRFKIAAAGASYEGKLNSEAGEISGIWNQAGTQVKAVFRRPGSAARLTLQPRKQGQVVLQPCRSTDGNVEGLCGTYEVFEDRQAGSGRKIALNIFLLPAMTAHPEPDPFFALAGGPGQSATAAFPALALISKIRALRDVVLVDQRGTGKSNPLQCDLQSLSDPQAIIGAHYSPAAVQHCREESDKRANTTQYTTSAATNDLDEIRQALGYSKINIFGGSYGAYAGLDYLHRHGDHVRSIALGEIAAPQVGMIVRFASAEQSSIDGIIAACEGDSTCHGDFPNLRAEFNTVVERLAKSPAEFQLNDQKVTLTQEFFLAKLRGLLYVPDVISGFPLIIHYAYANNWSVFGNVVVTLRGAFESGMFRGASFAALCSEDIPPLTEETVRRETGNTLMGAAQVRAYQQYCHDWGKVGHVPKDFYAPVHSDVPALLISGALDPATPPSTAKQVARGLPNSRLLTIKQGTHGTGSECVDNVLADFVKQGSVTNLDFSCAEQIRLPAFVRSQQADGGH